MSIITFWNDSREQAGKTLASIAVATRMSIDRNSKILLISTSFDDSTMKECFWGDEATKNINIFGGNKNNNLAITNGMEGLLKLVTSNKLEPSIITDYTRVIFKERLEVLTGYTSPGAIKIESKIEGLRKIEECYISLIKAANQYYDIVIVDLDKMLSEKTKQDILKLSTVNVYVFSQKMSSINKFNEKRQLNDDLIKNRCIPAIGKYDNRLKYNSKNISRFLGQKKEFDVIPLNILYMQAAEEAGVVDLFLKLRNVKDKTDENYIFMESIQKLSDNILKKIQEMQMRMR